MADINVVVEKLHSFETADDLADYFKQYGIKARPQEARVCAISQFVEIETGDVGNIITTTREISRQETVKDEFDYEYQSDVESYVHTHAMATFVRNFDSGKYPFLIEEGFDYDPDAIDSSVYHCYCVECAGPNED